VGIAEGLLLAVGTTDEDVERRDGREMVESVWVCCRERLLGCAREELASTVYVPSSSFTSPLERRDDKFVGQRLSWLRFLVRRVAFGAPGGGIEEEGCAGVLGVCFAGSSSNQYGGDGSSWYLVVLKNRW
jgi:hypothetical protein